MGIASGWERGSWGTRGPRLCQTTALEGEDACEETHPLCPPAGNLLGEGPNLGPEACLLEDMSLFITWKSPTREERE